MEVYLLDLFWSKPGILISEYFKLEKWIEDKRISHKWIDNYKCFTLTEEQYLEFKLRFL